MHCIVLTTLFTWETFRRSLRLPAEQIVDETAQLIGVLDLILKLPAVT